MLAMLASLAMPMTAICVTMRMQVELWPFLKSNLTSYILKLSNQMFYTYIYIKHKT